ncbi:MAG: hypothetical protein PHH28_17295 [Desulfuromonadaceae bacterium]|nr:hypothetical protein [Desulfuromonadaceae bacterium]
MITPEMTVLELLGQHPETEAVFESYKQKLGICICCEALFCTLDEVASRYEINYEDLVAQLNDVLE